MRKYFIDVIKCKKKKIRWPKIIKDEFENKILELFTYGKVQKLC